MSRNLAFPLQLPAGLSNAFAGDVTMLTQWGAFLKKNRLESVALADAVQILLGELHGVNGI